MRILERFVRRATVLADAALQRAYGWRWNPTHQSGTLAAWMLVVLTATGLYLVFFYKVGAPAQSVARIAADPWLGSWMRSVHRYATDLFVIAAALHALRLFGQSRGWGPRRRAWISGVSILGIGLVCAWTGFVMVWDTFGQRLAVAGARLIDALPVLSEPVGRVFAGDRTIPGAFFFINLFLHIGLPLVMGAGLWLHVSKLARPAVLPPRWLSWGSAVALVAIAIALPAPLGPAADALHLPGSTHINVVTSWWLPIAERSPPWLVWAGAVSATLLVLGVPRWTRRARAGLFAPSVVDPRLCTGCNQCPQDCPWDAIEMVPRADARPTLVAQVDPLRCVSCGICAGSCAPMGVGPEGRTGRAQLEAVYGTVLPALGSAANMPPVVVAHCAQAPRSLVRELAANGAHLHEVPCVGNLHSSAVELIVRRGGAGVL